MPVELGLEFMPVVCLDLPDPEWECSNHVFNEVDGIGLGVPLVDFEDADTRCVIDGGVLKATDLLAAFSVEHQKLEVHLNMVAGSLLVVALRLHLAHAGAPRQPI